MDAQRQLTEEIQKLVTDLPDELVNALAADFQRARGTDWQQIRISVMGAVAQPGVRARVKTFLDFWQSEAPDVRAESVSLGFLAAAQVDTYHRSRQGIELVWTGPDSKIIPLRRTDQALLQLINGAQQALHIVSFAVYKPQSIIKALLKAAKRGVSISIYLETPSASQGRMTLDTVGALGGELAQHASIYVWPSEKRAKTAGGKQGSLHAKFAVADEQKLLISSANLTEYAMTLNMEMGLLIGGTTIPAQAEAHLKKLIETGVFQLVDQAP